MRLSWLLLSPLILIFLAACSMVPFTQRRQVILVGETQRDVVENCKMVGP